MVLVHRAGQRDKEFDHVPERSFPVADLPGFVELHEHVAASVAPSKVVAIAVNTSLHADDADARRAIDAVATETGLPADDPVRFGGAGLWAATRRGVEALPWVGAAGVPGAVR